MQKEMLNNTRVVSEKKLITPKDLKLHFPIQEDERRSINGFRQVISNIIHFCDHRLLVVCGPCSIHDGRAAVDYARRLKDLSDELSDQLFIIMRVYFEKPRTILGWKGLINDPYMDNSFDVNSGLKIARSLLLDLVKINLPLATEILDPHSFQYIGEFFSWAAIGARTSESQIHREIASGLSMPVGFKNSTDGSILSAINGVRAASVSHHFMGINQLGCICLISTCGNPDVHIILRGGVLPNYYPEDIKSCEQQMLLSGIPSVLMIDCSHSNSNKDYYRQIDVAKSVLDQLKSGSASIIGLMIESNINAGSQQLVTPISSMKYGVSVTDACIDWSSTENLLRFLHKELKPILFKRLKLGAVKL